MTDFSKNRVLALYKILTKYTDEQHQISMQDILVYMESEGYFCSEDSIALNCVYENAQFFSNFNSQFQNKKTESIFSYFLSILYDNYCKRFKISFTYAQTR